MPTRLTADDYPGLVAYNQPVDTVAVGAVLAAANLQPLSERYRNVVNFVDAFFTGFQSLLTPGHHPKWREVNIAAELPGWRRFPPAAAVAAEQRASRRGAERAGSEGDLCPLYRRAAAGDGRNAADPASKRTTCSASSSSWQKGQSR